MIIGRVGGGGDCVPDTVPGTLTLLPVSPAAPISLSPDPWERERERAAQLLSSFSGNSIDRLQVVLFDAGKYRMKIIKI